MPHSFTPAHAAALRQGLQLIADTMEAYVQRASTGDARVDDDLRLALAAAGEFAAVSQRLDRIAEDLRRLRKGLRDQQLN